MLDKQSCNVRFKYPTINVMPSLANDNHWKQFGAWLKQKRRDANFTQVQVANRAGITDVQFARIEKGESGTKRETVINLAEAIGINPAEALNKAGFDVPRITENSNKIDSELSEDDKIRIQDLAKNLEGLADGFEKIESNEDREALSRDLYGIAKSMIDRELSAQERRKRIQST